MIAIEEISKVPVKASFVEYDDVVQALAANGSDDPFDISTLPRRARRVASDLLDKRQNCRSGFVNWKMNPNW
jgi:hypothetical protein